MQTINNYTFIYVLFGGINKILEIRPLLLCFQYYQIKPLLYILLVLRKLKDKY